MRGAVKTGDTVGGAIRHVVHETRSRLQHGAIRECPASSRAPFTSKLARQVPDRVKDFLLELLKQGLGEGIFEAQGNWSCGRGTSTSSHGDETGMRDEAGRSWNTLPAICVIGYGTN
jgi:hypothetical protein